MTTGYTPAGQVFTAQYDGENRLKSIEYTDSGKLNKIQCVYAGTGFLAIMRLYEDGFQVDEIRILRDGALALQERNESDAVSREYTWGLNIHMAMIPTTSAGLVKESKTLKIGEIHHVHNENKTNSIYNGNCLYCGHCWLRIFITL
jgi:hypothetical protein